MMIGLDVCTYILLIALLCLLACLLAATAFGLYALGVLLYTSFYVLQSLTENCIFSFALS